MITKPQVSLARLLLVALVTVVLSFGYWFYANSDTSSKGGIRLHETDTGTNSAISVDSDVKLKTLTVSNTATAKIDVAYKIEVAKKISLQILDPDNLMISSAGIEWLELTAAEVKKVNTSLTNFLSKLFQEELSHAYVEVSSESDGEIGEEIVVPGFDRRELMEDLQSAISNAINKDISKLIVERIAHDYEMGASKTAIRVSVGDGLDRLERITFTRKVLAEDAFDAEIPINVTLKDVLVPIPLSATSTIRSSGLSSGGVSPRIAHLLNAAEKLPKKKL